MFERFTDRARQVVVLAQEEARLLNHNHIGTEHLLLGLIHVGDGVAVKALESLSISLDPVRDKVVEIVGRGDSSPPGHIPFTARAKKVLELSLREALQLGHNYIGTEHILLGLLRERDGVAAKVLVEMGADLRSVRNQVIKLLSGYAGSPVPIDEGPLPGFEPLAQEQGVERWVQARRSLSHRSRGLLERALGEAMAAGAPEIEPEHLLLAQLGDVELMRDAGVDPDEVRRRLQKPDDEGVG